MRLIHNNNLSSSGRLWLINTQQSIPPISIQRTRIQPNRLISFVYSHANSKHDLSFDHKLNIDPNSPHRESIQHVHEHIYTFEWFICSKNAIETTKRDQYRRRMRHIANTHRSIERYQRSRLLRELGLLGQQFVRFILG